MSLDVAPAMVTAIAPHATSPAGVSVGPSLLNSPAEWSTLSFHLGLFEGLLSWLEGLVVAASGPAGLVVVFAYSFLIAFILPGPSEVVLAAPIAQGMPLWLRLGLIMVVSGVGKAAGSIVAFHIGQEAKHSGPVERWLRRSRWDVMEWSESKTVGLAQSYGYAGLALALSVPFFPDTLSIYAFAVLEEDYVKFALATFAGSVGRLLVTIGLAGGVISVL